MLSVPPFFLTNLSFVRLQKSRLYFMWREEEKKKKVRHSNKLNRLENGQFSSENKPFHSLLSMRKHGMTSEDGVYCLVRLTPFFLLPFSRTSSFSSLNAEAQRPLSLVPFWIVGAAGRRPRKDILLFFLWLFPRHGWLLQFDHDPYRSPFGFRGKRWCQIELGKM